MKIKCETLPVVFVLSVILWHLPFFAFPQKIIGCDSSENKKARYYFNEAVILTIDNKAGNISLLKNSINEDTAFAAPHFYLGEIYYKKAIISQYNIQKYSYNTFYFRKAEDNLIRCIELCEELNDYASFFYLGELYFINKEYALANYYLSYYIKNSNNSKISIEKAKDYIAKYKLWMHWNENPHQTQITPVTNICSTADEFLPHISHNGQVLYYTRKTSKKKLNSIYTEVVEEFFKAKNIGTDSLFNWIFTLGKPMPWPFNDGYNQGAVSLSTDHSKMYLTICQPITVSGKPFKNCDIYYTSKENDYWNPPEKLASNINSRTTWEAQPSLSSNEKKLFFASNRPNGVGGSDIYYCILDSLGNWSKPINMGKVINTINDEKAPFIHYDNKTLYYSSNGKFGIGGYDIFISRLTENNTWDTPVNIGKPFNTEGDEIGFVIDARGTRAYFASNHFPGKGGWDIFTCYLPKSLRPIEQYILNGRITDQDNKPITNSDITIIDPLLPTSEIKIKNNQGTFSRILPIAKKELYIEIKAPGFSYVSKQIIFKKNSNGNFVEVNLKRLQNGIRFELESINFESDSYRLNYDSKLNLDRFATYLYENPTLKIKIIGYTDNTASEDYNKKLSISRAKSVYDYLISIGVPKDKMTYEGKGENNPILSNEFTENRAKNRRIEIEILEK